MPVTSSALRLSRNLIVLAACLASAAAFAEEKPRIIVLDFEVAGDLDKSLGTALSEAATESVAHLGFYRPVSSAEVRTVLQMERQRELMGSGCSEDSSCLTELAGAMGAPFVMTGSVARFGEALQLTVQVLNAKTAQPVGRSVRLSKSLSGMRALVPYAVSQATGAPPPPPPSRVLPYSLIGGGAAVALLGGVVGLKGLADESELNAELQQASNLRTLPAYRDRAQLITTEKTVGLIGLSAGAVLIATGLFLNPADPSQAGLAVIPSGNGMAVVGIFP